jgi:hypothetical protein
MAPVSGGIWILWEKLPPRVSRGVRKTKPKHSPILKVEQSPASPFLRTYGLRSAIGLAGMLASDGCFAMD